jgi:hypothetical protein
MICQEKIKVLPRDKGLANFFKIIKKFKFNQKYIIFLLRGRDLGSKR